MRADGLRISVRYSSSLPDSAAAKLLSTCHTRMPRPIRVAGGIRSAHAGNPKTFQRVTLTAFQPGDGASGLVGDVGIGRGYEPLNGVNDTLPARCDCRKAARRFMSWPQSRSESATKRSGWA